MYPSSTLNTQLPEWYTLERKAEKSIKKLSTVKELDYYIKHPDEQLRRLAILRINELKLKDSFTILKEILDEPVETQANKELAAWSLKYISAKLDKDLFISHRLLTRYTGNESYNDLFNVTVDNNLPAPKFNFSTMSEKYRIKLKSSDILNAQISLPDMEFDFKGWLSSSMKSTLAKLQQGFKDFFANFAENMIKAIKGLPALIKKIFKKRTQTVKAQITCSASHNVIIGATEAAASASAVPSVLMQTAASSTPSVTTQTATTAAPAITTQTAASSTPSIPQQISTSAVPSTPQPITINPASQHKPEVYATRAIQQDAGLQSFRIIPFKEDKSRANTGSYYKRKAHNPTGLVKKILFEILYIILFPVRFILKLIKGIYRHKFKIIATAAAIYCLLVFTTFGRVASTRLIGVDLKSYHIIAVEGIKQAAHIAWAEVQELTGLETAVLTNSTEQTTSASDMAASTRKVYTVTAQNGLNIRTAPSSSAAKAGSILQSGAKVTYLDKSSKDSGGRVWFYITSPEGVNGWVYSGGLK